MCCGDQLNRPSKGDIPAPLAHFRFAPSGAGFGIHFS
jgi:hypothetical protein